MTMKTRVAAQVVALAGMAGCGGAFAPASASPPASASASASAPAPASASGRTIDPRVQRVLGEELDRAVAQWHASRAVAVVLDPATGAVLAMDGRDHGRADASLPSTQAWVTGSTLKTLTVAAALEERTISLDQRFACGERAYGAKVLHDARPCQSLDVAGILEQSSNVGTSHVFDTLGQARLTKWLHAFHVGDAPGTVPAVDDDEGFRAALLPNGELATATPLQMAAAYAAIFHGGVYVAPHADGSPAAPVRVLRSDTASTLVDLLGRVVTNGNGRAAQVDGVRVAGKTGTADVEGAAGAEMYYASFVGAVIDREPRFVALVGLEVPQAGEGTGPSAAAPMFAKVASRILEARR